MKKILIVLLSCVILTACGTEPVELKSECTYVTNEQGEVVKKPLRMIKIDGELYYDSGLKSDAMRCGVMDFELTRAGEEYEIPRKNGECNFSGASGCQVGTKTTKDVLVDGEWIIFRLFSDPEQDLGKYKYCFYLKGHFPNAQRDSEIVVLTDDVRYEFSDHAESALSAVFNPNAKRATFRLYGDYDKWGLYPMAKNVTSEGMTIQFEQFGGSPTGELQTGAWYELEATVNDKWQKVEPKVSDMVWTSIAYGIKKNDITELDVKWEFLYGKLQPGYYRISKEIADFRGAGGYDEEIYKIYFTVE